MVHIAKTCQKHPPCKNEPMKNPTPPRRSTKIVVTLGPASSDPQLLEEMIRTGVKDRKSTRLNSSHVKRSRMPSSA